MNMMFGVLEPSPGTVLFLLHDNLQRVHVEILEVICSRSSKVYIPIVVNAKNNNMVKFGRQFCALV